MPDSYRPETFSEALIECVKALGGSKKVGAMMRRTRPIEESSRWVRDCLNADRRERFDPDEVIWLLREARKVGCHVAMHFLADETGYSHPSPVEPADESAELQRQFIESVRLQQALVERLEAMGAAPVAARLKAVGV